jgi:hypothetical protein
MIIVYAGRRARSLPDDHGLGHRLRRVLSAIGPRAIVGAAADGSDLLVLEAALAQREPPLVHLVLPTTLEVFEQASVDEHWRERFARVLDRVVELDGIVDPLDHADGEDAYRAANDKMIEVARALAADGTVADERVTALLLATPGEGAMITDLATTAGQNDIAELRLDPAVDLTDRPSCFVAMPFGRKLDVARSIELDCDLLYRKVLVPALEHAQIRYRRADEEIDSGVVLAPMIEWIADADLVVGDLATANFNVGWELGLRHLLKAARTLLVLPAGTVPPFDLMALRHVEYRHDETGIDDAAAQDAWSALAPYLEQLESAASRSDSPVEAIVGVAQWARLEPRNAPDERFDELREQLALARDLRSVELMTHLAGRAAGLDALPASLVRAEAGVGLVRLGAYATAADLLAPLVDDDVNVTRPDAHLYYAQALYRPDNADIAALDAAERILQRLLIARPGHSEVRAALAAVAKRRSRRRTSDDARCSDLRVALALYLHDYQRDLDAFYEGINVVACGVALERIDGDADAGQLARRVLPAVQLAAELRLERDAANFWVAVTAAEASMYAYMLRLSRARERVLTVYTAAGRLRPEPGALHSSLTQFDWLADVGVRDPLVRDARAALERHAA